MRDFEQAAAAITAELVIGWGPCLSYQPDRIRKIFGDGLTALGICNAEGIPAVDKIWALCHVEAVGERRLHEFACACAEHVLPADCAPESRAVLEAKRGWLNGEVTDEELSAARSAIVAASAAESAARSAGWAAESMAGWAAKSAAWSAEWAAGSAAEWVERAAGSAGWAAESAQWAAGSAESAGWAACLSAAGSAGSAAERTEREWQLSWLRDPLGGITEFTKGIDYLNSISTGW